jgi:hypothetical protein
MRYGSQFVGDGYDPFLAIDGQPSVPAILGIDALEIDPYSKQSGGEKSVSCSCVTFSLWTIGDLILDWA